MIAALVMALLLQGVPIRPQEGGTVTGTIRTADGRPAAGIRVAARPPTNNQVADSGGTVLASLAQTDESGRYRLESILPGRYTISAGSVDFPTYYPGTPEPSRGTVLTIAAGTTTSSIDFTIVDASVITPATITLNVALRMGGNGKVPVFAYGRFPRLAITGPATNAATSLFGVGYAGGSFSFGDPIRLPFPTNPAEYRFSVENLPPGFAVKAMSYGPTDLKRNPLRFSWTDVPPAFTLEITLESTDVPPVTSGVRISGQLNVPVSQHGIYVSSIPGILYTDGTFEVRGVPPGKHFVVTGLSNVMAAGIIVGDTDVEGLELEPIALLPRGGFPEATVDNRAPGTKPRLATIRGRLFSEATGNPLSAILQVKGWSQVSFQIGADGKFEVPKLLPGSYLLEVTPFDHYTFNENVVVGEEDINLEFRVKRVY